MGFELPENLRHLMIDDTLTYPAPSHTGTQLRFFFPMAGGYMVVLAPELKKAQEAIAQTFGGQAAPQLTDIQPETEMLAIMDANTCSWTWRGGRGT
jgi:hypothetical protein